MKWDRTGRTVYSNGESDTVYRSGNGEFTIESRKRAIPHSNRSGYWMHTTYFLIDAEGTETEYYSLGDAKAAAERRER